MTRFARAGKCPGFGASGLTACLAAGAAAAVDRPSPSSEARAMEPSPTPQRPKKWRRVCSSRKSWSRAGSMMRVSFTSLARDELVEVEEHARDRGPGRVGRAVAVVVSGVVALLVEQGLHRVDL